MLCYMMLCGTVSDGVIVRGLWKKEGEGKSKEGRGKGRMKTLHEELWRERKEEGRRKRRRRGEE